MSHTVKLPLFCYLQEAQAVTDLKNIPPVFETDDVPKKKLERYYKAPTAELISYIDFSVSTTGILSGVKVIVLLCNMDSLVIKVSRVSLCCIVLDIITFQKRKALYNLVGCYAWL